MEYITTERGSRKLLFEGFCYVKQKDLSGGKVCWECDLRRKRQCKAKLHLIGDRVVWRTNEHTHAGNAARCEMLNARSVMKGRAETTAEPPQQIVGQAVTGLSEAASAIMPKLTDLRRTIRRNRQAAHPEPLPLPENAQDAVIPQQYHLTSHGGQFLQMDSGVGDRNRLLVFASEDGLRLLRDSPYWASDGTFKTVPTIFFQLYTVHCLAGNGQSFPCVYALITNKTQETYRRLMQKLAEIGGHPQEVIIDFERAAMNAITDIFPNVTVNGCFFHLAQNVYRQIQLNGLAGEYQRDPEFALGIRMIPAIAFVPIDDVVDTFEILRGHLPDQATPILDYFEAYIGRPRPDGNGRGNPLFPIAMWNVHVRTLEDRPRTNNNLEGWHRRFQADIGGHHPNLWRFLDVLKRQEAVTGVQIAQMVAGEQVPAQRRVYKDIRQRILTIVRDYANRDRINFLRGIAHNFEF